MGKFSTFGNDLYNGRKSFNFVAGRAVWYGVSIVLVGAAILLVIFRGLNLGLEFTGGTQFQVSVPTSQANQSTADELRTAVANSGVSGLGDVTVTTSTNSQNGNGSVVVQTKTLTADQSTQLLSTIEKSVDVKASDISTSNISSTLGSQIAKRALIGIIVFLFLVMLFIWAYAREWKMSVAALVALFHDIMITVGIYSLSGFSVTPAAVTGLLAILGFSLYDTVVVFDKIRENTKNLRAGRTTYARAANLAVNQTLVRSINTAIVALIPIGSILLVSALLLDGSTLQDIALAQFVGTAVGVYSSLFLAPRVLVHMKSVEDEVKTAERRARARAEADRYAFVPSDIDEGAPRARGAVEAGAAEDGDDEPDELRDDEPVVRPSGSTGGAMGRGRTAPPARGPMGQSNSSGRQQPSRQPRSQRGKK